MAATTTAATGRMGRHTVGDASILVARSKQFSISSTLASKSEWGDSDSGGYTARMPGRRDGTFTSEGVYDTEDEQFDLFAPGDKVRSTLWILPPDAADPTSTGVFWDFPCSMCEDFGMTVNIDTEEVIGWTSSWGSDGVFYRPGQVVYPVVDNDNLAAPTSPYV